LPHSNKLSYFALLKQAGELALPSFTSHKLSIALINKPNIPMIRRTHKAGSIHQKCGKLKIGELFAMNAIALTLRLKAQMRRKAFVVCFIIFSFKKGESPPHKLLGSALGPSLHALLSKTLTIYS
jgi:hypothetical protein